MKCALFPLLALVVVASTFGKEPAPTVTFVSPCECIAFHGVNRWVAKTDLSPVPSDKSAIQAGHAISNLRMRRVTAGCGHDELHRSENAIRAKMVCAYWPRRGRKSGSRWRYYLALQDA